MRKHTPITAYTLTYNEANQIHEVLESLSWADEIIIVDSFSTDDTLEIARQYGARVISENFCGFGNLRNIAIDAASHDWIFSLDADERCTPELAAEIGKEIEAPRFDAYHVPRKSHFMGQWMRHSGWYPDYRQPQFFNRTKMRYRNDVVHEGFDLNGRLGYFREHVLQYPWPTIAVGTAKLQRYSSLTAERYIQSNKHSSPARMLGRSFGMFLKVYLLRQGFRDGTRGLILATLYAYYTFLKYAKLWELQQQKPRIEVVQPAVHAELCLPGEAVKEPLRVLPVNSMMERSEREQSVA